MSVHAVSPTARHAPSSSVPNMSTVMQSRHTMHHHHHPHQHTGDPHSPQSPQSPPSPHLPLTPPTRPHTLAALTPPDSVQSIQKYSDALHRALRSRFADVARKGLSARPPPDAAHDPDYGYDEDPFDVRAKLLLSLQDQHNDDNHGASEYDAATAPSTAVLTPPDDPFERHQRRPRSGPGSGPSSPALAHPRPRRLFMLDSDSPIGTPEPVWLDSPAPSAPASPQPCSVGSTRPASSMSRTSSFSSESSFEVGRPTDYISLYGQPAPRAGSGAATAYPFPSPGLRPSPMRLTPSRGVGGTQTPVSATLRAARRRSRPYPDVTDDATVANALEQLAALANAPELVRTTSEQMLLNAGLATQRDRRRTRAPAPPATATA